MTSIPQQQPGENAIPSDYAVLKARIQDAGLLEKQRGFYLGSIACKMTLLAGSLTFFVLLRGQAWAMIADAVALAVILGQLGFQMHDAGHRQMFDSGRWNVVVGLLTADLLLGLSYGWWVDKHNRHHANPNDIHMDPDIGPGMISYSEEQAFTSRGVRRLVAKHQAALFFPLLCGLGWATQLTGIAFLLKGPSPRRWLEVALLSLHALLTVAFFTLLLGPAWGVAVIVIVECCAGFYMGLVFAPNHKGMPQVDGKVDFLRRQVLTARNVRPHPLTDVWYGALNYQIEHHLFPPMARNRIPRAHVIVLEFCAERGISYSETSILQSYREILHFLHEVGAPLREGIGAHAVASTRPRTVELLGPLRAQVTTDMDPAQARGTQ